MALTSTSTILPIAQGAMPGGGTVTNLGKTLKKYLPSTLKYKIMSFKTYLIPRYLQNRLDFKVKYKPL